MKSYFLFFFIVSIGYFLGKKNPNLDTSFITNYSANFGTPALILFAVMTSGLSYSMFADFFVYWLIAIRKVWLVNEIIITKAKHTTELCAIYWHFLLAVWLVLFGLMLFT